jgi:hypothetical protein
MNLLVDPIKNFVKYNAREMSLNINKEKINVSQMICNNIKCNKEFTGRPDRIYCSNKCGRSVYKRNLRIRKLSIDNEYEIALEKVNMGRCKVSIDDWVKNCNIKYDNYYDYTKVSFNKLSDVVTIICPKHGEFNKKATLHLHKSGCVYCCKNKSNIIHISDVKEKLHRNKYFNFVDFDVYKNNTQKIEVYCKKANHKSLVDARHLFNNNVNCSYCSNVRSHTTAEWIEKAIDRHQSKYDYSEAEYSGSKNKIKIICPTHGPFYQVPILHINGAGCRSCNRSIGESIISDILNMMSVKFESQKSFDLLKNSYDGIIIKHDSEFTDQYIVFHPEQIYMLPSLIK